MGALLHVADMDDSPRAPKKVSGTFLALVSMGLHHGMKRAKKVPDTFFDLF
jgi:hypothetical protein